MQILTPGGAREVAEVVPAGSVVPPFGNTAGTIAEGNHTHPGYATASQVSSMIGAIPASVVVGTTSSTVAAGDAPKAAVLARVGLSGADVMDYISAAGQTPTDADLTAAVQAAINFCAPTGGVVSMSSGLTLRLGSTLQGKPGVVLAKKGHGSGSNPSSNPKFIWNGTHMGGPMLRYAGSGQNLQGTSIIEVGFEGQTGKRPTYCVLYDVNADGTTCKVDRGTILRGASFARAGTSAIRYEGGITNLLIESCNWDHISGYAISINANSGSWYGRVGGQGTWDCGSEPETVPLGFLNVDGSTAINNSYYVVDVSGYRLEVNQTLSGAGRLFQLGQNLSISNKVQHHLRVGPMQIAPGNNTIAGLTDMFGFTSPTDDYDISWVNCVGGGALRNWIANVVTTQLVPPTSQLATGGRVMAHIYGSPGSEQGWDVEMVNKRILQLSVGGMDSSPAMRNLRGFIAYQDIAGQFVQTPAAGWLATYNDAGVLKVKTPDGVVSALATAAAITAAVAPALPPAPVVLTDAVTIAWLTASAYLPTAKVTIAGNRFLSISNPIAGQRGILVVTQDSTGGWTLTLPSGSQQPGGLGNASMVNTAAGSVSELKYYYDGATYWWSVSQNVGSLATTVTSLGNTVASLVPLSSTLADAATINWLTASDYFPIAKVTIGANRFLAISNPVVGQRGMLIVTQDGTGGWTLTLPSASQQPGGLGNASMVSTAANSVTQLSYFYDGTTFWWGIVQNTTALAATVVTNTANITNLTPTAPVVLTDAVTVNWATGSVQYPVATLSLTGNHFLAISGGFEGQRGTIYVSNTGAFSLTLPSASVQPGALANASMVTQTAGALDRLEYVQRSGKFEWTAYKNLA